MSKGNRKILVLQARAALIMAALRRLTVTCKELRCAIGLKGTALRNEILVLERPTNDCANAREPR